MPHADGRRCEWADEYGSTRHVYLGPHDVGPAKLDLFHAGHSLYAYPVVPNRANNFWANGVGYAYTYGPQSLDENGPWDLNFALHGGVTEEQVAAGLKIAAARAKARGLQLGDS